MVECQLPKLKVAGSSPVSRSNYYMHLERVLSYAKTRSISFPTPATGGLCDTDQPCWCSVWTGIPLQRSCSAIKRKYSCSELQITDTFPPQVTCPAKTALKPRHACIAIRPLVYDKYPLPGFYHFQTRTGQHRAQCFVCRRSWSR